MLTPNIRLERAVGRGGMGVVYSARKSDGERVAVKVLRRDVVHGACAERFEREARVLSALEHPSIVRYHGHGVTDDGAAYLIMEWLEGEDLGMRLARGAIGLAQTVDCVTAVCGALSVAHDKGLVHRDIKPENLYFARTDDGSEMVKVLDFGVDQVPDALTHTGMDPTRTGVLLGTPSYMSPEQAHGRKDLDCRSDLWALGVVAFECLTGQLLFEATVLGPLIAKIMMAPIPRLSDCGAFSPKLDAWFGRAVARDRDARFASARELAEALADATN